MSGKKQLDVPIGEKVTATTVKTEKERNSQNDIQIVKVTGEVSWSKIKVTKRGTKNTKGKVIKEEDRSKGKEINETQTKRKDKDEVSSSSNN